MERRFILKDNGLQIPCVLEEPEYCTVRRVVIGVHGFCGSKDSKILVDIAEEMGLFGAATLRFDFPAHGDSPVTDWELSLERCRQTLETVVRWAKQAYPWVDMGIFATGFGAFVTLVALERLEELVGKVKLVLQTPNLRMSDTLLGMVRMSAEQLKEVGCVTLPAQRQFDITYDFYKQVREHTALTTYDSPMLLLHGERDEYLPIGDMLNFRRINEQCKLVIIPGADHQFLTPGAWDMVVDLTRDWFEFEQVLLCDWS